MTIILNVLFTAVAVLFFAGRLFEIIALTDTATGFLTGKAIVTSPLMLLIICVMAVCCGVMMFAGDGSVKKMKKMPVSFFGYAAGFFFIAGGIISSLECFKYGGFIGYHMMEVLGGAGLVMLGISQLRGKKSERLPMLFILLLCVGVCLNAMVYEIKTIRDTDFMMRTLAGVTSLVFFTVLFKSTVYTDKVTKMLLYIFSQLNFVIAGTGSLAAVIGNFVNGTARMPQQLYNMGFFVLGVYSLFVAFIISPDKSGADDTVKENKRVKVPQPLVKQTAEKPLTADENRYMTSGNIDKSAIEMLFAQKAEREKQQEENYRAIKNNARQEYTQTVRRDAVVQTAADREERTAVIQKKNDRYEVDSRKKTTQKIVYKAPK